MTSKNANSNKNNFIVRLLHKEKEKKFECDTKTFKLDN